MQEELKKISDNNTADILFKYLWHTCKWLWILTIPPPQKINSNIKYDTKVIIPFDFLIAERKLGSNDWLRKIWR